MCNNIDNNTIKTIIDNNISNLIDIQGAQPCNIDELDIPQPPCGECDNPTALYNDDDIIDSLPVIEGVPLCKACYIARLEVISKIIQTKINNLIGG